MGSTVRSAREFLGSDYAAFVEQIDLVRIAGHTFDRERYLKGEVDSGVLRHCARQFRRGAHAGLLRGERARSRNHAPPTNAS